VHGVPGIVGALFIGFAASLDFSPAGANGLFYGDGGHLLQVQAVAVITVILYAALMTYAIGHAVGACVGGLRVSEEEEKLGLDISEHAELASQYLDSRSRTESLADESALYVQRAGDIHALRQALLTQMPLAAGGGAGGGAHTQAHTRLPHDMSFA
jgi:hypothetical protein